jgi:response regulator NasT
VAQTNPGRSFGTVSSALAMLGHEVVGKVDDVESVVATARALQPDLVVLDLDPTRESPDAFAPAQALADERLAPVMVLGPARGGTAALSRAAAEAGVMAYLPGPCAVRSMGAHIEIAVARWRQMRALERELARTRDRLRDRGIIAQAKGRLMALHNLTEQEAYEQMRNLSMDRRIRLRDLAEAILLATAAADPEAAVEQSESL